MSPKVNQARERKNFIQTLQGMLSLSSGNEREAGIIMKKVREPTHTCWGKTGRN